ncbi:hypothetical protein BGZ83_005040 [Gryganskiella cystojenkinii]|nr:hypothetical protein BGZ83_005040 [Gryganskiella cystojenkinii]
MHFYAALTTPPNLHAGIEPALLLPGNNLGHAPTVQVAALADGDGDDDDEDDEGADGDEEDGDGDGSSSESSPPPPPFGGDGGGGGGLSGADLGNWHDENATVTLQSVGYDNRGGGGSSNNESGSNLGHVPLNIAMDPRTTNTTAIITMPMATTSTWISTTINPSNPRRRRLTVDSEEDLTAEEISEKRLHRHQRRYQDELRGRSPTRKTRISSVHETMIRNNGKEKKPVSGRHPRQPGAVSISPSALQWKRPRLRSQTPLDSFATSSGTIHQLPPSHAQSTSYQAHLPSSASHLSPNDAIDIDVFGKEQDENNGKLDEEEDKDEATLEKLEG